ncbi:Phosphate metabolism transcription protein [Myotisia sp. PD_48]|nr:Phosphate metabolism transcription protein [Myotisia sp. PD_48]
MRFGKTLKTSVYAPWKDHYIDYGKLKKLLREHEPEHDSERQWSEEDEENFVQELVNVQLDKVNAFQVETYKQLRERTSECELALEPLTVQGDQATIKDDDTRRSIAQETLGKLDTITEELGELEKFSRINFSGFLKAAKKHDRKRGAQYRVRPLLQVRLSQLPFNSEDYSPLLYHLSAMYSFVRQLLGPGEVPSQKDGPGVDTHLGRDMYTSHKFWVHMDNILEVKTYILRRLPVLVYNPNTSKELDMTQTDPTLTSLYFDTRSFDLYSQKVDRQQAAGSLRLRWTGQLKDQAEIFLEKKVMSDGDSSREIRVRIKKKHVQSFLNGTYKMEKVVHKMETQNNYDSHQGENLKHNVEEIQEFIRENDLQPVLRANYTRTAFQIPGDNRVRISLDTNLALIREDSLDAERPCREPGEWHRLDIDDNGIEYPFPEIRTGEISRFPHALLEIKVRTNSHDRRRSSQNQAWIAELMSSHLVKEAPRFSKFVHGVAQLFEDYINSFPFWLSDLETDIRRDPETAFQEEQERRAQHAEDELAVGSFLGKASSALSHVPHPVGSPIRMEAPGTTPRTQIHVPVTERPQPPSMTPVEGSRLSPERPNTTEEAEVSQPQPTVTASLLRSKFPKFSMSRYALAQRRSRTQLPPGVYAPGTWIKDSGPVRVEPKVWLANQRTFIKWQHISILLAGLSLGLFNAAGPNNPIARWLALVYTGFAVFAGGWGWWMYQVRSNLIRQRSGRDLDNVAGPLIVCLGLAVALVLNFWFKYAAIVWKVEPSPPATSSTMNFSSPSLFDTSRPGLQFVDQS